jgi:uncharacterized protein YgiM (DUF1202 family)
MIDKKMTTSFILVLMLLLVLPNMAQEDTDAEATPEADVTAEATPEAAPVVDPSAPRITVLQASNIRSGPGIDFTIRGVVKEDSILTLTGRNEFDPQRPCREFDGDLDMWLRVDLNGVEGWIARCLAEYEGNLADIPVTESTDSVLVGEATTGLDDPEEVDEEIGSAPDVPSVIGYTRSLRINLRTQPNLDAEVLDVISTRSVYVTGSNDDGSWAQVVYDGQVGWMARYLLLLPLDWRDTVATVGAEATPEADVTESAG